MRFTTSSALLGLAGLGLAQDGGDLATAISNYTDLSSFSQILSATPGLLTALVPPEIQAITILVPSNAAFEKFTKDTGMQPTSLPVEQLQAIFKYHIMAARMTSKNFTTPKGLVVPTLLREQKFNNRSAGVELISTFGEAAAEGNVLFVSPDPINAAKLRVRQGSPSSANIRGGLGGTSIVSAIDGQFSLGYFQIIDTILSPPAPCSNTIRTLKNALQGLDNALNRSGLYPVLDTSPNVTCLAPNNAAFKDAGDPDSKLNETALQAALLFHTLPMVTYSNYLQDGLTIKSVGGGDVKVKLVDNDIYFNDAKVISPNVVTNNGLIHVLDKVMSPNGTPPSGGSTTSPTGTPTGTAGNASPTESKPGAAAGLRGSGAVAGLLAVVAAGMVFL